MFKPLTLGTLANQPDPPKVSLEPKKASAIRETHGKAGPAGNRRALRMKTETVPKRRKKAPSETEGALPTASIIPRVGAAGHRSGDPGSPRRP